MSRTLITIPSGFAIVATAENCVQVVKIYSSVLEANRGVLSNDQIFVWPHETGVHIISIILHFVPHIMNMMSASQLGLGHVESDFSIGARILACWL